MEKKLAERISDFAEKKKTVSVSEDKSLSKTKAKWKKMEQIEANNPSIKRRN